jgi:hypothetical protein
VIEIKTLGGNVLYTAENAQDVRAAVVEAAKARADLSGAYLSGADLSGAYLRRAYLSGADLSGADLRRADLRRADLRRADLRRADLRRADLSGAYLSGAYLRRADLSGADDDPSSPFFAIRLDLWSILDQAPVEVPALREALVGGQVDGNTYSGACACLVGTIAKAHGGLDADDSDAVAAELGIRCDSQRPAEQWFFPIRQGDVPVALDDLTKETSEGVFRASAALAWVDAWTESRQAIVLALANGGGAAPSA